MLTVKSKFEVVSVKKIDTPEGMTGNDWCGYVLRRDKSEITGMKRGTIRSVTDHAKDITDDLNARAGVTVSVYTSRKHTKT